MKIVLTKGMEALVDDEDYKTLMHLKWKAVKPSPTSPWYAAARVGGKIQYMHRLITGALKGREVDHINGSGLDNRKQNLRICSHQQNSWNSKKKKNGSTSIYKGVGWVRKDRAFQARIRTPNGRISLGYFKNDWEAALAYNAKAIELYGEFAKINEVHS